MEFRLLIQLFAEYVPKMTTQLFYFPEPRISHPMLP